MIWPFEIAERDHDIQNPTNADKIRRLGRYLRLDASSIVLDLACGKAGPAIILSTEFGCRVQGVELRPGFAAAAREGVADAGLGERITIETADASTYQAEAETFDAALCLGAAFVWGHIGHAAAALLPAVRPGGSVAVGEPFWRTRPQPNRHDAEAFVDLPTTAARFEGAGLALVGLVASSEDDWDHYESLHWRALEEWLDSNTDDPDAAVVGRQHKHLRSEYLSHGRESLGWAIFVGRQPAPRARSTESPDPAQLERPPPNQ